MIKINGYKLGDICPMCQYIQPNENIKGYSTTWHSKNEGMSEIKCPVCENTTLFKEWVLVKYPYISAMNNNKSELDQTNNK